MRPFPSLPPLLAALACLSASPALAQPAAAPQPPPSSPYADGTGNSQVDTLNNSQTDQNYTGWHQVPPSPEMPSRPDAPPPDAPPPPAMAPLPPPPPPQPGG